MAQGLESWVARAVGHGPHIAPTHENTNSVTPLEHLLEELPEKPRLNLRNRPEAPFEALNPNPQTPKP